MKTVLVPTDLSKNAGDTMRYAIEFAKEKKCQLVFLHCFYDKVDIETNWSELTTIQKRKILDSLKPFLYN